MKARLDKAAISREVAKRAQLSTLDLDVLEELCQSTTATRNAVVLAGDLVARRRLLRLGDPVGLVIEVLERLNDMGWIVYELGHYEVPVRIRPTQLGWHVAGYPVVYRDVSNLRHARRRSDDDAGIRHPGDRTDFHTHLYSAEGGPIEAMELWRHLMFYPDHLDLHADAMREMAQDERSDMASLREVIMDGVFDAKRLVTTNELWEDIKDKRPMSMVDVVSQIWNLQKTGELTFKERKGQSTNGSGSHHGGDLVDIELTPFGLRNVQKRRGVPADVPEHDRPFVKVTMDDVLAGTGMTPIEPPKERPKTEVTDRLTAWTGPKEPSSTTLVAASILADKAGLKVVEDRDIAEPTWGRGFTVRPVKSTVTDGGRHPVGKDMTDPKRHGPKARGGPVTKTAPDPKWWAEQNAKEAQVSASAEQVPAEVPSSSAEVPQEKENTLSLSSVTDLGASFPLIWQVVTREQKAAQAAKLLEEMGREDLAIQALEIEFSDLEKEVIELIKVVKG